MSLRISGVLANTPLLASMNKTQNSIDDSLKKLGSGSRVPEAKYDPAGSAMATQASSQARGYTQALMNVELASSLADVAESALAEQANLVTRLRELAVQSASSTYSDQEREFLQVEAEGLLAELERISESTRFSDKNLLNGSTNFIDIQSGIDSKKTSRVVLRSQANTTLDKLSLQNLDLTDQYSAKDALENIDFAFDVITKVRSEFGSFQSRIESLKNQNSNHLLSLQEINSKLFDANFPEEMTQLRKNQAIQSYQLQLFRSALARSENEISLFG